MIRLKTLALIVSLVGISVQLRMRDVPHYPITVDTTPLQHPSHMLSSNSMQIDYSKQILLLSDNLHPAADINNRITRVKTQNLQHNDSILLLANFTFSQLDTKDIKCNDIQADVIQSLLYRTSQMRAELQYAIDTSQVNFLSNSKQRLSAAQSLKSQVIYLQGLEKFLQSGCSKHVLISKTFFVSNLNANNWILGDWSYDQFIRFYLDTVSMQQIVTKCPIDQPYFDTHSGDCINCFYPNNVWNMKLQKCADCPYSQVVNLKTRQCASQILYVNNIMDQNQRWITKQRNIDKVYQQFRNEKNKQNAVVCPFDSPFVLNEKCSTCPDKSVYALEDRNCVPIPYRMEYDKNLHKIVQKLENYQTNQNISSNIISGLQGCPSQYPYYDDVTCIDCRFPNYFNQRRRICEPCPDLDLCAGRKLVFVTNSLTPNVTAGSTKEVKDYFNDNANKMKDDSVQECPLYIPYYNPSERKCIQCPKNKNLFNISSLTCVSCPGQKNFNQKTYLCEQPKGVKTNSKAPNLIIDNITSYNKQQSKLPGPQCSLNLPYFNGKQCQSCPSGQQFNTSSKSCVTCPNNTSYDKVLMECNEVKYKSYSGADRLWILNKTEYDANYQKNTVAQCPAQEPYYNGSVCMKCSSEQIFNTSSLSCTQCPANTIFDTINKNCSKQKTNLYVPGKTDNLLGVPSYTVDAYLNQLSSPNPELYNVTKCPEDQNSKKSECVSCTDPYPLFNVKTLECVQCSNLDQTNKICYDNMTYLTNTTKKDKLLGVEQGNVDQYVKQQETKIKETPDLYIMCPQDKPFSLNGTCQNCEKLYNVSSGQCTVCNIFDSISQTCAPQPYFSNLKYGVPPYYTNNATRVIEQYNKAKKSGSPVCPFTTPFFNGKQCIVCPKTDQYFNLDLKRCENCSVGYQFNPIIYECQQEPPKYYTSLESANLIFDGQPISYYEYKVELAKKAGSGACPQDTPYYTMSNQCEICNSPTEYFNLLRRTCTSCPEGTSYTSTDHECESPMGDVVTPQPTLEKSLANSFTD